MALLRQIDRRARRATLGLAARAGLADSALTVRDRLADRLATARRAPALRRHRSALRGDEALLLVRHEGRWQLARRDERLVARDVALANLTLVVDAFDAASIPYFVVPEGDGAAGRVGVARGNQAAALSALVELGDPAVALCLDDPDLQRRQRVVRLARGVTARLRPRAMDAEVWWVYRPHADPAGKVVLGHRYGCAVEFWSESADGEAEIPELTAPRWNKKAEAVPREVATSASVEVAARALPTAPPFVEACHFDEVTFPVDLVYTWVDGSDPVWVERKNAVLRALDLATVSADSADASRYASRDELKYSLRSVAMFADFARTIHIVTDDQVPPWLDTGHPRVRVVSHKEIFAGAGRLPTFNSHAIEARLHHIDGLAEHYVYLNDDFFFCRRVRPETFFLSNGLSKFYLSSALMGVADASADTRSVDAAARNSRRLLQRQFSRTTSQKFRHAPYPQRRSVLYEMEEVFADEFSRTWSNQVRSPDDVPVPSSLYHYYAYLTGRAVPGSVRAKYAALGQPDFHRRLREVERKGNADTLCINDTAPDTQADVEKAERTLQAFLDRNWPVKSEFER